MSQPRFDELISATMPPEWWAKDAKCRDADPDLFFVEPSGDAKPGIRVCEACPVQEECLEWALETRQPFGTFGGVTERHRREMYRTRGYAA